MKTIAVTGVTGFVGKRLMEIDKDRYYLRPLSLRAVNTATIDLNGVDALVHLAGKAHQMEPIDDKVYFDINFELTKALAVHAKEQGVPHFIYISSTKVYGDDIHCVLNEQSPCHPSDAYGASKLKAEQYLKSLETGAFKISIIRPPLIYGPEVKGNMNRLLKLATKNLPLPFGKTNNYRSIVFLDNLIELINIVIEKEASGIFVAGDGTPVSTTEILVIMRKYIGNKYPLISIPFFVRKIIKKIKPALYTRLFGSFEVDNTATNRKLGFIAPFSTEQGIAAMANWYKKSK